MAEPFPKEERDRLLAKGRELWARMYPEDGSDPSPADFARWREAFYQAVAEYSDRLPRVPFGVCPFTGEPLVRAIDPHGVDGWWWHVDCIAVVEEPRAPAAFRLLLGALALGKREPTEALDAVKPGPEVPYVIPSLLALPGMRAVVGRIELPTGDVAWPVSYWSEEEIDPIDLHQPWLRDVHWFTDGNGSSAWTIANDVWDFDLAKWVRSGQLAWADLSVAPPVLADPAPLLADLPGERRPQLLAGGSRSFLPLPDGNRVVPFGEPPDPEKPPKLTPEESKALEGDDDHID